jgi:hypothetical protein
MKFSCIILALLEAKWRHDTQHNGSQHNDTQHNDTEHNDTHHNDTQHNNSVVMMSVIYAECHLCPVSCLIMS